MMRIVSRMATLALFAMALSPWPEQALAQQTPPTRPSTPPPSRSPITRPPFVPLADPGRLLNRPSLIDGDNDAVVSLYKSTLDFARCMQHSHPQRVAALLEKPLSSRAEELAADRLLRFSGSCPGGRLRIGARMLRGAAAESILDNLAAAAPDRARHLNNVQAADFAWAMPSVDQVRDRTSDDVQNFVGCQVVLAPGLARKVITAEPGSNRADDAAAELIAATGPCGTITTLGGPSQIAYRSYLAEALYHWTRATASNRVS